MACSSSTMCARSMDRSEHSWTWVSHVCDCPHLSQHPEFLDCGGEGYGEGGEGGGGGGGGAQGHGVVPWPPLLAGGVGGEGAGAARGGGGVGGAGGAGPVGGGGEDAAAGEAGGGGGHDHLQ